MPRRFVFLLLSAGWAITLSSPALAHPFGPPPTARLQAQGSMVIIHWSSAPDDAIAIGEQLGVLPPGSTDAYRGGVTQVAPAASDQEKLDQSPQLHDYLLERITVEQAGVGCQGRVQPLDDFVNTGARVVATCAQPVTEAEVSIRMLTDIHEAYRTFAVGQNTTPAQTVYTIDTTNQVWDFTGARAGGGRPDLSVVGIGVGLVIAAAAALVLRRRAARGAARA